jgi:replication factor C large subunit
VSVLKKAYDLYSVESLDDILGNEHAIAKMRGFCKDVNRGTSRTPLMLFGQSGIGKSASVHLLAKENDWNVVELNASDYRDRETIERRLMSAATSKSLLGSRNLIILDEIDETVAGFDKGIGPAISGLVEKSKNPIIFIVNNMWDRSIMFLRGKVDPIEFKRLAPDTIHRILLRLCRRFSFKVSDSSLQIIANRSNGDARSAINDMAVIMGAEDEDEVTEAIGLRYRKIDIFNALDKIFLTNTISSSLRAVMSTDVTNDMLIKWIDENIPKRYSSSEELLEAFDSLSYASIFSTRAMRSQYYTYWRYMNVLMSSGVALSKRRYPDSMRGYTFPRVIKDLSGSKASRSQEKAIAAKLQRIFHSSIRKIMRNEMRMLSRLVEKSMKESKDAKGEVMDYLASAYLLDEKEIKYMLSMNS